MTTETSIILSSLDRIREECNAIELALGINRSQLGERASIMKLTFREFVQKRLDGDSRIKGIPLFHGVLDHQTFNPWWPDKLHNYKTIGDVPMEIFVSLSEQEILKIKMVSVKGLRALGEILREYGIKIRPHPLITYR